MSDLIPQGIYRARAKSWDLGETDKGKEQIAISFAFTDVPEVMGWYGYFTDKALPITVRALRACGWQGTDLTDLTGLDANEVDLVVEHEEYEGKVRAKVKFVNEVGGGAMLKIPMDEAKRRIFAAKMRGAIAGLDSGVPRPAPKKQYSPEPPPHSDGDIPF